MSTFRPALALLTALIAGCSGMPDASAASAAAPVPATARAIAPRVAALREAAPPEAAPPEAAPPAPITLNNAILAVIDTYASQAHKPYVWSRGMNTDGVSHPILWQGAVLAAPEADGGIHCSGITFEVYVAALENVVGETRGPTAGELLALKEAWYVRDGNEQGPVGALVGAGLGDRVAFDALQPGDLVQFWRNNGKGHSVVFLRHTMNTDGSIHGMMYWSAQGTSGGIGVRRTSAGPGIDQINASRLYGVRPRWPGQKPNPS